MVCDSPRTFAKLDKVIFIDSSTSSKLSSFVDKEIFAAVLPGFIVTDCDTALKSVPEIAVPELEAH